MVIKIQYSKQFLKHFDKRINPYLRISEKFDNRIALFSENPDNPLLHNHPLKGTKLGLWSFSITGDVRVIYQKTSDNSILLLDIGTHNQVYK